MITNRHLWESMAADLVTESFRAARRGAEEERLKEAAARRDILDSDFRDLILARIRACYESDEIFRDVAPMVSLEHNLLQKIAGELSTVYQWGAQREIVGGPDQLALARGLWEESAIDETLEKADYYLTGMRDIILIPQVVDGEMSIEILTPDRFGVRQNPKAPTRIESFWYERALCNTPGAPETATKVYADKHEWRYYDARDELISAEPHGLGRLPGVVVHADKRLDAFFDQTSMTDVAEATLNVGMQLAFMSRLLKWQSEKQLTFSGRAADINSNIQVGAHAVLTSTSGAQGQWGLLELQASVDEFIKSIQARVAWVAQQHGIAADVYTLSDGSTSGFQFRLKRLPLLEQRARRQKVWLRAERELWRLMALVAQRQHPLMRNLSAESDVVVRHLAEPNVEDPQVQTQVWERHVAAGFMSRVDVLMEKYAVTRAEAKAMAERIDQDQAERNERMASRNVPADPSQEGKPPKENGAQEDVTDEEDGEK